MIALGTLLGALVIASLIGIHGEFPLSDDASFAYAAKTLCTTGSLKLLPWTAPTLVLQAAYGAALCRIAGFSFTVLRASTVALGIAGVVGFARLLRELGVRGRPLAFATALFALNPLYVNLAFTFMTDVPFTALLVWSAYAYARGLTERRIAWIGWGAVAATGALLIRQQGVLIAIAAALAAGTASGSARGERVRAVVAALALPVMAFVAAHLWLVGHGLPQGYATRLHQVGDVTLASVVNCGFRGCVYLGLLLAPFAAALGGTIVRQHRGWLFAWWAVLGTLAGALFIAERALMFYLTNVLYDFGLGALTLRDVLFLGYDPPVHLGLPLAVPLTLTALLSAGVLGAALTRPTRAREPVMVFLHAAAVLVFAATLLQARYYLDRHLLPVIPLVLAAVSVRPVPRPGRLAVVLLVLLAWYAVAGTHDYLAWNRARFAGLDALAAAGVPPTAIDGGVEFNAWHLAPVLGTWPSDREARRGQPATARSWWWVADDRFVASFRPLEGYHAWRSMPYRRWLVPGTGEVLILERSATRQTP